LKNSKSVLIILGLIFFSCLNPSHSQSNPKTFYIGHSLTDYIPEMVESLSDSSIHSFDNWGFQSIPGAPLRWQWGRTDVSGYAGFPTAKRYPFHASLNGLTASNYDILVLTESAPRHTGPRGIVANSNDVDSL